MKRLFVCLAVVWTANVASASSVQNCIFDAQVLSVQKIAKLGGVVTERDKNYAIVLRVFRTKDGIGSRNCARHKSYLHVLKVNDRAIVKKGDKLRLRYRSNSYLSSSGPKSNVSYNFVR